MKYLKYLQTTNDFESFKNNEDYILPNVSYVVETEGVSYEPAKPAIIVTAVYNVTNTSSPTKLLGTVDGILQMKIDGVNKSINYLYTFDTVGEHTVEFTLKGTSIGDSAFYYCTGLTSITIPDSVTSIGSGAFRNCSGLTSIDIPDSVTSIGDSAFENCEELTSIVIPDSVTSIGDSAFMSCSGLTSINIPNSVTSIGYGVFGSCRGLTSVVIPDSVTSIGNEAFILCKGLTSIVIPDSVTSIGSGAFSSCSGSTSLTIGSGVTSIGNSAFYNCSGLTSITSYAVTAPTIESNTFKYVKDGGILYVPVGSDYSSWMSTYDYYLGKYNWTILYI